jgi:MFS transporter, AAHS family, 4-hydroxybenzoate transporter
VTVNDTGTWSAYQKYVVAMVATALMLDGLDAQMLGLAIPALMRDWGLTRAELTPIAALSLIGMATGATFGGWIGDRVGRRLGLICSVALFGVATGLASQTHTLFAFGLLRAVAGVGLGAALPNATALIAEYTPDRFRSIGISIAMLSQPVGSMIAGLLAAALIERAGWSGLFLLGGIAPVLVALAFIRFLPESPRYLAGLEKGDKRATMSALLHQALRRDTLLAWIAAFMSLLALYTILSWGPAMLAGEKFPLSFTGKALATFSVGGILGSIACGLLIRKIGSRWTQIVIGGVGIAVALTLCALFASGHATTTIVMVLMAFVGFSAAGTQTTLYALGAHLYPTYLRATGIGAILGIGRLGAVVSAKTGAISLDLGGAATFFVFFGIAIAVATLACSAIRRPIPALQ